MSFLLDKSIANQKALVYLSDVKLYAPSIHCGYYSCFQKIVHILKKRYSVEYGQELKFYETKQKGNLHGACIRLFTSQLKKIDKRDALEVDDLLKQLKDYRLKSDYEDTEIFEKDVDKVKEFVSKIHRAIKIHMKEWQSKNSFPNLSRK